MEFFEGDAGLRVILWGGHHFLNDVCGAHGHSLHGSVPKLRQDIKVVQRLDLLVTHVAEHAHAHHAARTHLHTITALL